MKFWRRIKKPRVRVTFDPQDDLKLMELARMMSQWPVIVDTLSGTGNAMASWETTRDDWEQTDPIIARHFKVVYL